MRRCCGAPFVVLAAVLAMAAVAAAEPEQWSVRAPVLPSGRPPVPRVPEDPLQDAGATIQANSVAARSRTPTLLPVEPLASVVLSQPRHDGDTYGSLFLLGAVTHDPSDPAAAIAAPPTLRMYHVPMDLPDDMQQYLPLEYRDIVDITADTGTNARSYDMLAHQDSIVLRVDRQVHRYDARTLKPSKPVVVLPESLEDMSELRQSCLAATSVIACGSNTTVITTDLAHQQFQVLTLPVNHTLFDLHCDIEQAMVLAVSNNSYTSEMWLHVGQRGSGDDVVTWHPAVLLDGLLGNHTLKTLYDPHSKFISAIHIPAGLRWRPWHLWRAPVLAWQGGRQFGLFDAAALRRCHYDLGSRVYLSLPLEMSIWSYDWVTGRVIYVRRQPRDRSVYRMYVNMIPPPVMNCTSPKYSREAGFLREATSEIGAGGEHVADYDMPLSGHFDRVSGASVAVLPLHPTDARPYRATEVRAEPLQCSRRAGLVRSEMPGLGIGAACNECSAGSVSVAVRQHVGQGRYPGKYFDYQCVSCPPGFISSIQRSQDWRSCSACPPRSYQNATFSTACAPCPLGTFCNVATVVPGPRTPQRTQSLVPGNELAQHRRLARDGRSGAVVIVAIVCGVCVLPLVAWTLARFSAAVIEHSAHACGRSASQWTKACGDSVLSMLCCIDTPFGHHPVERVIRNADGYSIWRHRSSQTVCGGLITLVAASLVAVVFTGIVTEPVGPITQFNEIQADAAASGLDMRGTLRLYQFSSPLYGDADCSKAAWSIKLDGAVVPTDVLHATPRYDPTGTQCVVDLRASNTRFTAPTLTIDLVFNTSFASSVGIDLAVGSDAALEAAKWSPSRVQAEVPSSRGQVLRGAAPVTLFLDLTHKRFVNEAPRSVREDYVVSRVSVNQQFSESNWNLVDTSAVPRTQLGVRLSLRLAPFQLIEYGETSKSVWQVFAESSAVLAGSGMLWLIAGAMIDALSRHVAFVTNHPDFGPQELTEVA